MEGQIPKLYGADATEIPGARALLGNYDQTDYVAAF